MREALNTDKQLVIDILSSSFEENKSINFVVKQDAKRKKRIQTLMEYSFFVGQEFGKVFISDDENSCAILIHNKKDTLKSIVWDLKLVFKVIGLRNVLNVLKREKELSANHPNGKFIHLWYVGVFPEHQGKGIGSKLISELMEYYQGQQIYLETSTLTNLPLYKKFGFEIIKELDLGYKLFVLKK